MTPNDIPIPRLLNELESILEDDNLSLVSYDGDDIEILYPSGKSSAIQADILFEYYTRHTDDETLSIMQFLKNAEAK